jgi:hypothetical protein
MNKEEKAAYRKTYIQTVEGRANKLWLDARRRAKQRGVPFDITKEWVIDALRRGTCPRTYVDFYMGEPKIKGRNERHAPSLDRIVALLGYTPSNTQVVTWAYNCAKHTWTDEDLLKMSQEVAYVALSKKLGVEPRKRTPRNAPIEY